MVGIFVIDEVIWVWVVDFWYCLVGSRCFLRWGYVDGLYNGVVFYVFGIVSDLFDIVVWDRFNNFVSGWVYVDVVMIVVGCVGVCVIDIVFCVCWEFFCVGWFVYDRYVVFFGEFVIFCFISCDFFIKLF